MNTSETGNEKYRMPTPVCDFVRRYASSGSVRMHMPGHKGRGSFLGAEAFDITEIAGADALYEASGVIRESEENATKLFGTKATFFGTEGSSQMIRAMLYLAGQWAREQAYENGADRHEDAKEADRREGAKEADRITILAARNVHKSFVQACALLDYDVEWLYGEENTLLSCTVSPETLEKALKKAHKLPAACFITSPDYLGKTADIRALAAVCHRFGVPFLVDNAHGAYLRFLDPSRHPMDLGADLCCDSAHKTLPVLTGGAYLHVADPGKTADHWSGETADKRSVKGIADPGRKDMADLPGNEYCVVLSKRMAAFFAENAKSALALFGSTSPSYLILQSLDACNRYLSEGYREKLADFAARLGRMKERLSALGIPVEDTEELKLTVRADGLTLAGILRTEGIECEFADREHLVLMPGPENSEEELLKCESVLAGLSGGIPAACGEAPVMPPAERVMTIREAVFSRHETIPVAEAAGRVAGAPTVSCPPAVPIVVSGERISDKAAEAMRYYGLETVEVVK